MPQKSIIHLKILLIISAYTGLCTRSEELIARNVERVLKTFTSNEVLLLSNTFSNHTIKPDVSKYMSPFVTDIQLKHHIELSNNLNGQNRLDNASLSAFGKHQNIYNAKVQPGNFKIYSLLQKNANSALNSRITKSHSNKIKITSKKPLLFLYPDWRRQKLAATQKNHLQSKTFPRFHNFSTSFSKGMISRRYLPKFLRSYVQNTHLRKQLQKRTDNPLRYMLSPGTFYKKYFSPHLMPLLVSKRKPKWYYYDNKLNFKTGQTKRNYKRNNTGLRLNFHHKYRMYNKNVPGHMRISSQEFPQHYPSEMVSEKILMKSPVYLGNNKKDDRFFHSLKKTIVFQLDDGKSDIRNQVSHSLNEMLAMKRNHTGNNENLYITNSTDKNILRNKSTEFVKLAEIAEFPFQNYQGSGNRYFALKMLKPERISFSSGQGHGILNIQSDFNGYSNETFSNNFMDTNNITKSEERMNPLTWNLISGMSNNISVTENSSYVISKENISLHKADSIRVQIFGEFSYHDSLERQKKQSKVSDGEMKVNHDKSLQNTRQETLYIVMGLICITVIIMVFACLAFVITQKRKKIKKTKNRREEIIHNHSFRGINTIGEASSKYTDVKKEIDKRKRIINVKEKRLNDVNLDMKSEKNVETQSLIKVKDRNKHYSTKHEISAKAQYTKESLEDTEEHENESTQISHSQIHPREYAVEKVNDRSETDTEEDDSLSRSECTDEIKIEKEKETEQKEVLTPTFQMNGNFMDTSETNENKENTKESPAEDFSDHEDKQGEDFDEYFPQVVEKNEVNSQPVHIDDFDEEQECDPEPEYIITGRTENPWNHILKNVKPRGLHKHSFDMSKKEVDTNIEKQVEKFPKIYDHSFKSEYRENIQQSLQNNGIRNEKNEIVYSGNLHSHEGEFGCITNQNDYKKEITKTDPLESFGVAYSQIIKTASVESSDTIQNQVVSKLKCSLTEEIRNPWDRILANVKTRSSLEKQGIYSPKSVSHCSIQRLHNEVENSSHKSAFLEQDQSKEFVCNVLLWDKKYDKSNHSSANLHQVLPMMEKIKIDPRTESLSNRNIYYNQTVAEITVDSDSKISCQSHSPLDSASSYYMTDSDAKVASEDAK